MAKEQIAENTLKVWYIPQVGAVNNPFEVIVPNIATAKIVMDSLTGLSNYEFENEIKPDYADAIGLSRYEDDGTGNLEWVDWEIEELEFEHQSLPIVPDFVAKLINELKENKFDLSFALKCSLLNYTGVGHEKAIRWKNSHQEEFVRAWKYGYTIEKPQ